MMSYDELEKVIAYYRLQAEQTHLFSEQELFRYRNFANVIETNIDLLEDATDEDDLWEFYNEHANDGWDLLNPDEEY